MRNNDGKLNQFSIFQSFDPTSANRKKKKKGRRRRRRRRTVIIILLLLYYRRRRRENGRVGEAKGRQIARGMRRTLNCVSCVCILLRFYFISFHFFLQLLCALLSKVRCTGRGRYELSNDPVPSFSPFFSCVRKSQAVSHISPRGSQRGSQRGRQAGAYTKCQLFSHR